MENGDSFRKLFAHKGFWRNSSSETVSNPLAVFPSTSKLRTGAGRWRGEKPRTRFVDPSSADSRSPARSCQAGTQSFRSADQNGCSWVTTTGTGSPCQCRNTALTSRPGPFSICGLVLVPNDNVSSVVRTRQYALARFPILRIDRLHACEGRRRRALCERITHTNNVLRSLGNAKTVVMTNSVLVDREACDVVGVIMKPGFVPKTVLALFQVKAVDDVQNVAEMVSSFRVFFIIQYDMEREEITLSAL